MRLKKIKILKAKDERSANYLRKLLIEEAARPGVGYVVWSNDLEISEIELAVNEPEDDDDDDLDVGPLITLENYSLHWFIYKLVDRYGIEVAEEFARCAEDLSDTSPTRAYRNCIAKIIQRIAPQHGTPKIRS